MHAPICVYVHMCRLTYRKQRLSIECLPEIFSTLVFETIFERSLNVE